MSKVTSSPIEKERERERFFWLPTVIPELVCTALDPSPHYWVLSLSLQRKVVSF